MLGCCQVCLTPPPDAPHHLLPLPCELHGALHAMTAMRLQVALLLSRPPSQSEAQSQLPLPEGPSSTHSSLRSNGLVMIEPLGPAIVGAVVASACCADQFGSGCWYCCALPNESIQTSACAIDTAILFRGKGFREGQRRYGQARLAYVPSSTMFQAAHSATWSMKTPAAQTYHKRGVPQSNMLQRAASIGQGDILDCQYSLSNFIPDCRCGEPHHGKRRCSPKNVLSKYSAEIPVTYRWRDTMQRNAQFQLDLDL